MGFERNAVIQALQLFNGNEEQAAGFLFGGCGVAAIAALSWIYNYVSGNQPAGYDTLDYAKGYLADKARDVKERAKDYGSYAQGRINEATQGAY